jgi:diguanylate cyclase (GGDEF)-like protein
VVPAPGRQRPRLDARTTLAVQGGLLALALVFLLVAPITGLTQARVSWSVSVAANIGCMLAAAKVARRLPATDPAQRFWWAICGAAAAFAVGYLIQIFTATDANSLISPAVRAFIAIPTAALVGVMCLHPLRIRSGRELACFWLDMATVLVGAAAYGWYFFQSPGGDLWAGLWGLITGPVVNLVAVFAVAKLLITGRPPFSTWTGLFGAAAPIVGGIAGSLEPGLLSEGNGRWLFALSALGDGMLLFAATMQRHEVEADPQTLSGARRRPYSMMPYMAVAATYGLLIVAIAGPVVDGRTWSVLVGAGLSTLLVVARQLAAFAENGRLVRTLDAKVGELHKAEGVLRAALAERDALANRLRELAFQDSLTGLANRALLHERLATAQLRATGDGSDVVVLLLDLDDFKPINDRYGHAAGDAVLIEVSRRLTACLRPADTVARLGGDEFAVLLDGPPADLHELAGRMVDSVREPYLVGADAVRIGVSIGVAVDCAGQSHPDQILDLADVAMYAAKGAGKNGYRIQENSAVATGPRR